MCSVKNLLGEPETIIVGTPNNNGEFRGRTQANLESIAKSIDDIWDKIDELTRAQSRALERLAAVETKTTILAGFLLLAFGGIGGLAIVILG